MENENLLDDVEVKLLPAAGGARFVNLLIDWVLLYLVWRFGLVYVIGTVLVFLGLYTESETVLVIEMIVFVVIFDVLVFATLETLTKGKTLGKLITRTRAVNEDGSRLKFKTALLRSVIRMVPLEVFTGLTNPCCPLHDWWSKTLVIDDRGSRLPL